MNKLLTVLVALLLLLATPLPTLANPASAAKAKALVDNAVRQTKTLIAQADKAHGDEKKIKTLVKQYVTRMERLGHTGETLNDKLTEAEQKKLDTYAKGKMEPYVKRLGELMDLVDDRPRAAPEPKEEPDGDAPAR